MNKKSQCGVGLVCTLLCAALVPASAPAFGQVNLTNNPFIGNTYGSSTSLGPVDPDSLWLQPGNGGMLLPAQDFMNHDGMLGVVNSAGPVQTDTHPFFAPIGANGRGCVTCHQPSQSMSLAAANVRLRWDITKGQDPLFAAVDGSNCPVLPQADKASHSLTLDRGVFRIALPLPTKDAAGNPITPDFTVSVVRDPNGCNSGAYGPAAANPVLSVYRRPRVVANFPQMPGCGEDVKMAAIMADGREATLKSQAVDASLTHLEMKAPPSADQLKDIVAFECQVYAAQSFDRLNWVLVMGDKSPPGLGPQSLVLASKISTYLQSAGDRPVFQSFGNWDNLVDVMGSYPEGSFRASVARGAAIFSGRHFQISGAMGVNTSDTPVNGTCATCHDLSMSGMASARWIDTGSTNQPWAISSPDLPLFKITCNQGAPAHPFLGRVIYTQDPGRAMVTGKCADVGAITVQQLRGLAARAPYFSNGSAKTLADVVDFYDRRFKADFTPQEKEDLVNFLGVL